MTLKRTTELDFFQIKENLKTYLKGKPQFADVDFEGSGINVLLDALAHNTQYNAMLAHMTLNESFIDSAQIRSSVVSHAEKLGYAPFSARAAETEIDITITGTEASPDSLTISKDYLLTTQVGDNSFDFLVDQDYTATKGLDNTYTISNVRIFQGEKKSIKFRVDIQKPTQEFELPVTYVDMSKLTVRVSASETTTETTVYASSSSVLRLTGDSLVYFVSEDGSGKYRISFGDGIIGRKLEGGEVVTIDYYVTDGALANGARTFSPTTTIGGLSAISVSLSDGFTRASQGIDPEEIESIRLNAPRAFATKGRAVTAIDYKNLLLTNFDFIEDLAVWGGEDNNPPQYGKVFVSVKPKVGTALTASAKGEILKFLQDRAVVTVIPEMVDPAITKLALDVLFKYDPTQTVYTRGELETLVANSVLSFINTNVNRYDSVIRYSNLLAAIDSTLPEILNSIVYVTMKTDVTPFTGASATYDFSFANPIDDENSTDPVLQTSPFTYNGIVVELKDRISGDVNVRTIDIVKLDNGNVVKAEAGTVDLSAGRIVLPDLVIDSTETIEIKATPKNFDIYSVLSNIVDVKAEDISVVGTTDSIAIRGSGATIDYDAF